MPETDLGRFLFRRQLSWGGKVAVAVLFLAGAGGTAAMISVGADLVMIAGFAAFSLALGAATWAVVRSRTDVHEKGLRQRTFAGHNELLYENVAAFTLEGTRGDSDILSGKPNIMYSASFRPIPGKGAFISLTSSNFGGDLGVEGLRNAISAIIAKRMQQEIELQGKVEWSPRVFLSPHGVHYQAERLLRGAKEELLPWAGDWTCAMNNGTLWFFEGKKNVFSISTSMPNFFPGYAQFQAMDKGHERREG